MLWSLNEVSIPGRRTPRLDRVTVPIPAGITAVMGQSGAGKTSLLNVLVRYEVPSAGQVSQHWKSIANRPDVFWVPPSQGLWSHLTVREHLDTVCPYDSDRQSRIDDLLSQFDLAELSAVRPGSLSLGERSRLCVARALASGAQILVMDEPLAHVDSGRVGTYWAALRKHCECTATSLIFATHSFDVALREATHVICLAQGQVIDSGPVRDLYERPKSQDLANLLGPCNWLSADEIAAWMPSSFSADQSMKQSLCVRPEQLSIERTPEGTTSVESVRFGGSSAEVDVIDDHTGRRGTFVHRPSVPPLQRGDRVLLKLLMLLVAVFLSGCMEETEPVLPVKGETYWSMPPDGPRVPAPRGMTVSPNSEYVVLDNAGRVLFFDVKGTVKQTWWMPEYSVGKAEGVCILKDGRVAVADTHYYRIVLFNPDGTVQGTFGKHGTGPGEFEFPVSVIQDDKEFLYICEYGNFNDRVQKFRPDGTYVSQIGSYGTEDGQFQRPSGAAWFEGLIYVADAFNNRIQVFDENGKLIEILGKSDKISELYYPYDIAVTERGELYVVEYGGGRVSKFDRSGKLLGRYGHTGQGSAQFKTPWGLAVDNRGHVFVCDTGNHRIVDLEL